MKASLKSTAHRSASWLIYRDAGRPCIGAGILLLFLCVCTWGLLYSSINRKYLAIRSDSFLWAILSGDEMHGGSLLRFQVYFSQATEQMSPVVFSWFLKNKNKTELKERRSSVHNILPSSCHMLHPPFILLASAVSEFPTSLTVNPKALRESSVN